MRPHEDAGWKALGDFIRSQRQLADLSLRQLSDMAKVSNAYLSQVERGMYKPSAHVLKSIAGALEISAETLFARAGLLEDHEPEAAAHADVARAIRLDPRLSTDQKETLLRVYRSFVGEND